MGRHKETSKKHKREKKHKEKKHHKRKSTSSSEDEWVEKAPQSSDDEKSTPPKKSPDSLPSSSQARDDWMSLPTSFSSVSNLEKRKSRVEEKRLEREREKYNPAKNVRELNPYWKDGGDGLPQFKKPTEDDPIKNYPSKRPSHQTSNWRKKPPEVQEPSTSITEEDSNDSDTQETVLTDKELNILAAKLVKAEILGNQKLVTELKTKLEAARQIRESHPAPQKREAVILTHTDAQGHSRPVKQTNVSNDYSNPKKKKKVETHQDGERIRFFADDDNQTLQEMFENEKYNSVEDQNSEFLKMASKIRKNDDLEEVFEDGIRKEESSVKKDTRNRDKAINEHKKVAKNMDNCRLCIQSETMPKHLMVTLGETYFLSLPAHEPLTEGHCLIAPIRHVSCSTLLDENEWADITQIRKSLTQMFAARNLDAIFFETAKNLSNYPHMHIECIPIEKEEGDLAPIYFKKAIDECEAEWAQNKKLVSLKDRNVRKAIPRGLSYFFVSFGMQEGYAHVIEEENEFPNNFAQEIIAGMLDLHHTKWRKPKRETFQEQSKRVLEFSKEWKQYDTNLT